MKKSPIEFLSSNRLTAFLFLAFPAAMAMGTFIESWYSTDTAKIWIYNAWWFEALMSLLMINFIGNIFKYRLLRKEKWAILLLHLSFILILFGAFITRYIGYEGVMPIREGETTASFLSEKTYLTVWADGEIDGVLSIARRLLPLLWVWNTIEERLPRGAPCVMCLHWQRSSESLVDRLHDMLE